VKRTQPFCTLTHWRQDSIMWKKRICKFIHANPSSEKTPFLGHVMDVLVNIRQHLGYLI